MRAASGEESWRPVFAALNLPLISEFSSTYSRKSVNGYLASAGLPACPAPVMAEREAAREARLEARWELQKRINEARRQGGKDEEGQA